MPRTRARVDLAVRPSVQLRVQELPAELETELEESKLSPHLPDAVAPASPVCQACVFHVDEVVCANPVHPRRCPAAAEGEGDTG